MRISSAIACVRFWKLCMDGGRVGGYGGRNFHVLAQSTVAVGTCCSSE